MMYPLSSSSETTAAGNEQSQVPRVIALGRTRSSALGPTGLVNAQTGKKKLATKDVNTLTTDATSLATALGGCH